MAALHKVACLHSSLRFGMGGASLRCLGCEGIWLWTSNGHDPVPALTGTLRVDSEQFSPTERPTASEGLPK